MDVKSDHWEHQASLLLTHRQVFMQLCESEAWSFFEGSMKMVAGLRENEICPIRRQLTKLLTQQSERKTAEKCATHLIKWLESFLFFSLVPSFPQ